MSIPLDLPDKMDASFHSDDNSLASPNQNRVQYFYNSTPPSSVNDQQNALQLDSHVHYGDSSSSDSSRAPSPPPPAGRPETPEKIIPKSIVAGGSNEPQAAKSNEKGGKKDILSKMVMFSPVDPGSKAGAQLHTSNQSNLLVALNDKSASVDPSPDQRRLHYKSYFHADNKSLGKFFNKKDGDEKDSDGEDGQKKNDGEAISFSIIHEVRCAMEHFRTLYRMVDANRLSWTRDFANLERMSIPKNKKEITSRLNLNIPYYSSNYLELCYVVTLPFLLFHDIYFFIFLLLTCITVHSVVSNTCDGEPTKCDIHQIIRSISPQQPDAPKSFPKADSSSFDQPSEEGKTDRAYSQYAILLGREVRYHKIVHVELGVLLALLFFFHGFRTLYTVFFLNLLIVVPHALLRNVTYFDDEDMEKLRPKIVQYIIIIGVLVLLYLEGDTTSLEEDANKKYAEEYRARLKELRANKSRGNGKK